MSMFQTHRFYINLLVWNTPSIVTSTFSLRSIPEIENVGIDLYEDDGLHNFVTKDF